jgi:hypothetical protein
VTAPATGGGRRRGVAVVLVVAVVGGLLLAGSLTAEDRGDRPYDPASTRPTGTRALVELIEGFGSRVDVPDRFPVDADVAVVFQDVIPSDAYDEIEDWVAEGHTLVVGDPRSELAPPAETLNPVSGTPFADDTLDQGHCTIDALADARQLDLTGAPVGAAYVDDGNADVCFGAGRLAFVRVDNVGDGHIVGLAGAGLLQNRNLGRADNAVLAIDLIAPRRGTRVAVLTADAFPSAGGRRGEVGSLSELFPPSARLLLAELGVALAVLAVASARRLGRPLAETQPVQIAGSELVGAVGDLLRQQRDPDRAAGILRADLRRTVAGRTGLPPDAPPAAVAEAVAARTGRPVEEVRALLEFPVAGDAELVRLAEHIDTVREEVLHGRTP